MVLAAGLVKSGISKRSGGGRRFYGQIRDEWQGPCEKGYAYLVGRYRVFCYSDF